ncbi:MAG: hypothetical protein HKM93_08565 [Desulfobacteraceae bacterium]|nr:hypothetical protein [Desulfobacteraceae bacterium]
MINIGSYNELVVEREVDFGLYLNKKPEEVLLPRKYVPKNTNIGDTLRVFVYLDSEERPVATTLEPKAVVGECAYLRATDITAFGAFLDWGLEKDLLVPGKEQPVKMKKGKKYVVKVCRDEKDGRIYASANIKRHCQDQSADLTPGQKVELLIYNLTDFAFTAVIDNNFTGILYKDQLFESIRIGDRRIGYIHKIRDDGKIDLTLKQPGYHSIKESSDIVLSYLKENDGVIPYHDKSTPEEIKRAFSMSKKEFKRAIGKLYKNGIITIADQGIRLRQ